jgi:hypothetical protein
VLQRQRLVHGVRAISHAPRAPEMKTFSANVCFCWVSLREWVREVVY